MLSISARSATAADLRAYLEGERDGAHRGPEDYYAQSANSPGRWTGRGAAELGLTGEVTPTAFERLAEGQHPESAAPIVQRAGAGHRPGWDLTFSAPKSVSVVWGLAEPESRARIEAAHRRAVERTLDFADNEQLFVTRRGKNGIERETAQPIIATYLHGTSREADPQLHTHAFVFNVAARESGGFGTLESKPLYQWKMALGAAYRAELAHELNALGYDTTADARGNVRLAGVPHEVERHFSKRRQHIEAELAERGASSAKASERAALATRSAKTSVTLKTLRDRWQEEGRDLRFSPEHLERQATPKTPKSIDTAAVIERVGAEHSTFTRATIARAVAERAPQADAAIADIAATMQLIEHDPEIVRLNAERFTTRRMLTIERGAVERARRLSTDSAFAVHGHVIDKAKRDRGLSEEQSSALDHLTRPVRLATLEGLAGTGKSHLLGAAREVWEAAGYQPRAAALAGKAAQGLQSSSGLQSQTVHSLLVDLKSGRDSLNSKTVLVIDEAGMVGSRQLAQLLKETDKAQAKLVLVGDANQLQPIAAGQLFERVSAEVGTVRLTEIRRQRGAQDRAMVHALARGDTREALDSLKSRGRLHAAPDRNTAIAQLVHDWSLHRDARQPGEDLMLGATRADVRALNRGAREHLKSHGELSDERDLDTAQGPLAVAAGERIVITRNAQRLGLMNGDLATVLAMNTRRGGFEITARTDAGRTRTWRLSEHPHIEHGYAVTVHKAQGVSVERAYVLAHDTMSAGEWSYVAGSRAREAVHLYAEQHTAEDLERIMGRSDKKDTSLDYEAPVHNAEISLSMEF